MCVWTIIPATDESNETNVFVSTFFGLRYSNTVDTTAVLTLLSSRPLSCPAPSSRARLLVRRLLCGSGPGSRRSSSLWAATSRDTVGRCCLSDSWCSVHCRWACGSQPSKRTLNSYGWKVSSSCLYLQAVCCVYACSVMIILWWKLSSVT